MRGVTTDYPFSAALRARLLGTLLTLLGVIVFVTALMAFVFRWQPWVLGVVALLVVVAVVLMGSLLSSRAYVVRTDAQGYRVRFVRGAGAKSARWSEVEELATATVGGDKCVVVRLKDGRTTTIPVAVLAVDPEQFVREVTKLLKQRR
jgi:uncharacterized membrane protein